MLNNKLMDKNYMENKIIQIIYTNLKKYIEIDSIKYFASNGLLKYVFNISNYYFEISYNCIDNFYQIKFESKLNNQLQSIVLLTKSKEFHNQINLIFKDLKLSRKLFENHIYTFCNYICKILEKYNDLNYLEEAFIPDLKFDGIFI